MDNSELERQLETANYRLQRQQNINSELGLTIAKLEGTIKALEFIIQTFIKKNQKDK